VGPSHSIKKIDASKLREEYHRLVQGLKDLRTVRETDDIMSNPGMRGHHSILRSSLLFMINQYIYIDG
jgi:hypothetical protein